MQCSAKIVLIQLLHIHVHLPSEPCQVSVGHGDSTTSPVGLSSQSLSACVGLTDKLPLQSGPSNICKDRILFKLCLAKKKEEEEERRGPKTKFLCFIFSTLLGVSRTNRVNLAL